MKYIFIIILSFSSFGQGMTKSRLKKISNGFGQKTQKNYVYSKVLKKIFNPFGALYLYTQVAPSPLSLTVYKEYNSISFLKTNLSFNSIETIDKKSCTDVCPENINILNYNKSNYKRSDKNSLSFVNNPYEFLKVMRYDYGFCWGHASLTNALKHLAFFDPEGSSEYFPFSYEDKDWREYMLQALVDIFNYKPRVLPYIENIRHLSNLFEKEMKAMVVEKWGNMAIHLRNNKVRSDNQNNYSESQLLKIISELEHRLNQGQKPEVIFNMWGSDEWIHVSLVESIKKYRGDRLIRIRLDDNKIFNNIASLLEEESIISIDLDSKEVHYSNADKFSIKDSRIGRFAQTKSNYRMYDKILPRLVNFCKQQTECT